MPSLWTRYKNALGGFVSYGEVDAGADPDNTPRRLPRSVPSNEAAESLFVTDRPGIVQERSAQGAVPMTTGGAAISSGRLLFVNCSVAGDVSVTFVDNSTLVVPVSVGPQFFPFAVTKINTAGTTATATYANLS